MAADKAAAKALAELAKQQQRRQKVGAVRDSVAEQTKHSTRRTAYDLNGKPH